MHIKLITTIFLQGCTVPFAWLGVYAESFISGQNEWLLHRRNKLLLMDTSARIRSALLPQNSAPQFVPDICDVFVMGWGWGNLLFRFASISQ